MSSSSSSSASTAPSTPAPPATHYLVLGSPAALKILSSRLEDDGRIFFVTGSGPSNDVTDVVSQALNALGIEKLHWEAQDLNGYKVYSSSPYETSTHEMNTASQLLQPDVVLPCASANQLSSQLQVVSSSKSVNLYILFRPPFVFPPLSETAPTFLNPTAHPFGIPSMDDWSMLWKAWDCVTLGMIPRSMLHEKPIDLRHKCLFYLGHIPTFLDMLLSRELGEPNTEPKWFTEIFERGIDPHVDDPDHCHRHSVVPTRDEDWPTLEDIISFRTQVRKRVSNLYDDFKTGKRVIYRHLARVIVMTYEHEAWHVETLLYMLIQRSGTGTLPPPRFPEPLFSQLSEQWSRQPQPASPTVVLGPATITLGVDDPESDDAKHDLRDQVFERGYVWDNESPVRTVQVGAFRASWRPVTNGEYARWWRGTSLAAPASWAVSSADGNEDICVRTAFGPVPLAVAEQWPVLASYDDLAAYATFKGGRLPTEPELRLFLDTYEVGYDAGANTGFRNWHPVPSTAGTSANGKGSNGGVWEWTSTPFDTHDRFDATDIFSGYSSDFFDGKHHVVLGASYATLPRQAGRRTIRNFYQHNYPYAWVGARVVFDC